MPTLNEAKKRYTLLQLRDAVTLNQLVAKLNEITNQLAANSVTPTVAGYPTGTTIASAQTGNANSTAFDFGNNSKGNAREPVLVRVVTTVGATPTCTYAIQGSEDNQNWTALNYADSATPFTVVSTTFVITTASTSVKVVQRGQRFRYLRVVFSANTNVTNTVDVLPLGD